MGGCAPTSLGRPTRQGAAGAQRRPAPARSVGHAVGSPSASHRAAATAANTASVPLTGTCRPDRRPPAPSPAAPPGPGGRRTTARSGPAPPPRATRRSPRNGPTPEPGGPHRWHTNGAPPRPARHRRTPRRRVPRRPRTGRRPGLRTAPTTSTGTSWTGVPGRPSRAAAARTAASAHTAARRSSDVAGPSTSTCSSSSPGARPATAVTSVVPVRAVDGVAGHTDPQHPGAVRPHPAAHRWALRPPAHHVLPRPEHSHGPAVLVGQSTGVVGHRRTELAAERPAVAVGGGRCAPGLAPRCVGLDVGRLHPCRGEGHRPRPLGHRHRVAERDGRAPPWTLPAAVRASDSESATA